MTGRHAARESLRAEVRGAARRRDAGTDRTASTIVVHPVLRALALGGVNGADLLQAAGLSREALENPERRLSEAALQLIWRAAAKASGDEFFGLSVAEHAETGAFDVLDFAVTSSPNLRDALHRIARFHRLLSDSLDVSILDEGNLTLLRTLPPRAVYRHECESFFALIVSRLRSIAGFPLAPTSVHFSHAAPSSTERYLRSFGVVPHFQCRSNRMVFAREDCERPARASNEKLALLLDRYASEMQARLPPGGDLISRVTAVISKTLSSGEVSLRTVSGLLDTSPRTLQRQLIALGTTYRELLEDVRRDVAVGLAKTGPISATETAFLLGFAAPSSLHRVFKRWTGWTPRRFPGARSGQRRASP